MRYSGAREIDGLVRTLVRSGWTFRWGGKNGRVRSPDVKASMTVPTSPSDRRNVKNFFRDRHRSGAFARV